MRLEGQERKRPLCNQDDDMMFVVFSDLKKMKTLKGFIILLLLLLMMMVMMRMTMTTTMMMMMILMILTILMIRIADYDRFQRTDSYDQNQICVLEGISRKAAGIPRSELYITSKVAKLGIVGGIVVAGFHRMAYLFRQQSWFRREIAQIFSSDGSMLRKNNDDKNKQEL